MLGGEFANRGQDQNFAGVEKEIYGQFTYHFNYWGPTGVNRDVAVRVRKLDKVEY